tara:strand:- start:343 stop:726 length:384 start_codon:yes stop_codon:yes gene_type:complete
MAQKWAAMELSATGLAASAASETSIVNNAFNKNFVITQIAINQSSRFGISFETASNQGWMGTTYIDATALCGSDDMGAVSAAGGSVFTLNVPIVLVPNDGMKLIYQERSGAGSSHYIYVNLLGYLQD